MKKIFLFILFFLCFSALLNSQEFGNWKKENWKQVFNTREYFDPDTLKDIDTLKKFIDRPIIKYCDSLNCVLFCSTGKGAFIFKTTDGGLNWRLVLDNGILNNYGNLLCYSFPSPEFIIISCRKDDIQRTLDGGITWDTLTTNLNCVLLGMDFNKNGFGIAHAYLTKQDATVLIQSTDYGSTWSVLENQPNFDVKIDPKIMSDSIITCISYNVDSMFFYFCRSDDKGKTWSSSLILKPKKSESPRNYFFFNEEVGWITIFRPDSLYPQVGENTILKTIDGGKTWQKKLDKRFSRPEVLLDIQFADSLKGMCPSRSYVLVYTTDGGETWIQDSSFILDDICSIVNYLAFLTPRKFIICTIEGLVFKYDEDGFSSVNEELEQINSYQVFPNPASSKFEYKINLDYPQSFKIETFDILGNSALPAINCFSEAGEYSHSIDISSLPKGIYFVITNANNQRTATKLIKVE
ncbi:MAG TPA: T9SS type A sorting domain-containing protein [Candidatus Kapabacteria bacterium]|nr:T9SS type A sorting domain-containing protein [Candidatus Kapabacteria bacterium]